MHALIGKEWYQSRALYNSNDNKLIMDEAIKKEHEVSDN